MDNNGMFSKERKGYSCSEVDKFLIEQSARHAEELSEKDAEIKRMFSENEDLKERLLSAEDAVSKANANIDELKKHALSESDRINARIGEKLNAAEEASREMLRKAEAECEEMKRKCRMQIADELSSAHKKAEKYCERAKRIADIYEEKQQLVTAGIEQSRRHLESAVNCIDEILNEKI